MQYRVLGKTGLRVSALGFGTMRFQMKDEHVDEEIAVAALRRAMDLGVNYFDSAVGYCNSESEKTLGKALKDENILVRKYACEALSNLGRPAVPALLEAVKNNATRDIATEALLKIK
jgi:predicted aldo/keto reductase-like oxidoreductase